MIGSFLTFLEFAKRPRGEPLRCYYNGVEIDKLDPPLPFLKDDDWLEKWILHLLKDPSWEVLQVLTQDDPDKNPDTRLVSIWAGRIPEEARKAMKGLYLMIFPRRKDAGKPGLDEPRKAPV